MRIELKENVHLLVISTKKYKTTRIVVRFSAPLAEGVAAGRSLLANVMETNSAKFPVQTEISKHLAELYGAGFHSYVDRKGDIHRVNFSLTTVGHSYVEDEQLLENAVKFLKEILFHPNMKEGSFDEETFRLEQENLVQSIEGLVEDKGYYANQRLQELYYTSSKAQGGTNFGTAEEVKALRAEELAKAYHEMIQTNPVDILVMGDVDEEEIQKLVGMFPFSDRSSLPLEIFYEEPYTNVVTERVEQEELAQSKLNLAYHLPVRFGDESYVALQVFNGLFGGFPHSKLFVNVREKESLAYYASSSFDSFRSLLTVKVGIDGKNREKVLQLIQTQLLSLAAGEFTRLEFAQTKEMLKNSYLEAQDHMGAVMEHAYLSALLPQATFTQEEWLEKLVRVSEEEVAAIAKAIKLQAVFFLSGVEPAGE